MEPPQLEYDQGIYWCWIVWAMKPADLRVVAICTNEALANQYTDNMRDLFPEHRLVCERAPLDHTFGASDLRSVAGRAAIASYRNRKRTGD